MFRMRRYRVFIIFAVIAVGALYHFTSLGSLESAGAASVEGLKNFGQKHTTTASSPASEPSSKESLGSDDSNVPILAPSKIDSGNARPSRSSANLPEKSHMVQSKEQSSRVSASGTQVRSISVAKPSSAIDQTIAGTKPVPADRSNKNSTAIERPADPVIKPEGGGGRLEILAATGIPKIHWTPLPEHFAVPTESIIQLPTSKPKAVPKVQHDFTTESESATEKAARVEKLDVIKNAFAFSWTGYKKHAWMQDELSPLSGKYRNTFCGWGATLVDSLDALWMMGLKDDFKEAVEAVKSIDFTTSTRNDIPLFEVVIRYLGGLIGAYDISGGAYRTLLDKAVELADVLMGAFDTPNRMPMTYYLWKPTFASQPHRAKTRVVLAELGSLSLEFTRLAQITKEAKYYDAVARVTNELEIWQYDTKEPGLWPLKVDASGCKKPDSSSTTSFDHTSPNDMKNGMPVTLSVGTAAATTSDINHSDVVLQAGAEKHKIKNWAGSPDLDEANAIHTKQVDGFSKLPTPNAAPNPEEAVKVSSKEAAAPIPASSPGTGLGKRDSLNEAAMNGNGEPPPKKPSCEPQGLASPPFSSSEQFTMGGQADSTYEYLPKEFMLLGGLEIKYQSMYEMAAERTKRRLLYRPMIPDEKRHLLHAGLLRSTGNEQPDDRSHLTPEGTHLTCFVGGMFAVGARIFDRKDDMDIAKRLTDGCVWAYESTTTGIMPENYETVACENPNNCPWNETLWHEKLDPYGAVREQTRLSQQKVLLENQEKAARAEEEQKSLNANTAEESTGDITADTEPGDDGTEAIEVEGAPVPTSQQNIGSHVVENSEQGSSKAGPEATSNVLSDGGKRKDRPDPEMMPLRKRQLGDIDDRPSSAAPPKSSKESVAMTAMGKNQDTAPEKTDFEQPVEKSREVTSGVQLSSPVMNPDAPASASVKTSGLAETYSPPPIPTRKEFVEAKIRDERLPKGMTKLGSTRYILRPEAIESVFILYRVTGDVYWREKGWKMFQAIHKHTMSTYGASAISDVTSETPSALNEMESFWLAETLKYFYLLFSDPSLVSLDDYVLNTEAHPFKRPK